MELNLYQTQTLLKMFGGEDAHISLTQDAEGVKAYYTDYPDEGSIILEPRPATSAGDGNEIKK